MRLGRILAMIAIILFTMTAIAETNPAVLLLEMTGPVGPATQDYIHRGLAQAVKQKSPVVILQIDTPGGLSDSMRGIIQDIIASPIPVLGFVYPSGARAASAGTYILYACPIAAMAPGTNLGAASPVSIGMPGGESDQQKNKPPSTEELKALHDAEAYIRSLAELRHRNADWAELAVSKAASLTAQQALQQKVIDLIAVNPTDLLTQADGKTVLINGQLQIIHSRGFVIKTWSPDWRTRFLATITNPSVAYILLIIGVYGLFFEFMNPGFVMPGVAGVIALLLALYAFQLLPIDYAGLALIFAGLGFIIAEIFFPTFGALGIGGAIAFLAGSIMLLKPGTVGFSLPIQIIIGMTLISALFFLGIVGVAIRARKRPIVSGREAMIGQMGEVTVDRGEIWILVAGERWQAIGDQSLQPGQHVKVIGIKGLKLLVKPVSVNDLGEKK